MPSLADIQQTDSIGIPRFTDRQTQAIVRLVKQQGKLNTVPPPCSGRGIVIAGGGKYLSWAWVMCRRLRDLGCRLPIQVWHFGDAEMPRWARPLFTDLDAEPVDALAVLKQHRHRMINQYVAQHRWMMAGWCLKVFAVRNCPWQHVLFLDADCAPTVNPDELFDFVAREKAGGLFFPDVANHAATCWGYTYCSLLPPAKEWEAGIFVIDKRVGWMGLQWANWMNEHADVFFTLGHGDKFTLELGFRVSEVPIVVSPECEWQGWGIQHSLGGKVVAQHLMGAKRGEHPFPPEFPPLFWEFETLSALRKHSAEAPDTLPVVAG